jgi:hypothetical protein
MNRKHTFLSSTRRTLTLAAVFAATPAFAWAQEAPPSNPADVQQSATQQTAVPAERVIVPAQTQALFNAMRTGNREAARAAILAGADANVAGSDGMTALMRAAQLRQPEIVQLLLDHGARTDAADKAGRTALHYTVPEGAAAAPKPKKKKKWGKILGGLASVATGGLMGGLGGGMLGSLGSVLGGLGSTALGGMLGGGLDGMMAGAAGGQSQVLSDIGPKEMEILEKLNAVAATGDQAAIEAMMKTPEVAALIQKLTAGRPAAAQVDETSRTIINALMQKGAVATATNLQGKTPAVLAQERGLSALAEMLAPKEATAPASSTPMTPVSKDEDDAHKGEDG